MLCMNNRLIENTRSIRGVVDVNESGVEGEQRRQPRRYLFPSPCGCTARNENRTRKNTSRNRNPRSRDERGRVQSAHRLCTRPWRASARGAPGRHAPPPAPRARAPPPRAPPPPPSPPGPCDARCRCACSSTEKRSPCA